MTITDPVVKARLDDRYGRTRSRGARAAQLIALIVVALLGGWLLWSMVLPTTEQVDYDDLGYEVTDETSVTVRFQVTSSSSQTVACALEALDTEFGVVGWRIVEYPPATTVATSYTEEIPTLAEATTGIVKSCWVP